MMWLAPKPVPCIYKRRRVRHWLAGLFIRHCLGGRCLLARYLRRNHVTFRRDDDPHDEQDGTPREQTVHMNRGDK